MHAFLLRATAALFVFATVQTPATAQERVELDHLGLSFELPSDWVALPPGIHSSIETRTFTSPDEQLSFSIEVYNFFDDEARLSRWVRGEALARISGADQILRVTAHPLSDVGNHGHTFVAHQSGSETDVRFFEHRGRGVAFLIGGEPTAREQHEALLTALINSIRVD